LFAGSIGKRREDFIEEFGKEERKVHDFFDRIHFDLILPSIDEPAQAQLIFLNAIRDVQPNSKHITAIQIERPVLYLFGMTLWESARQIRTICRVAVSRKHDKQEKINDIEVGTVVKLHHFKDIKISNNFSEAFDLLDGYIKSKNVDKKLYGFDYTINVIYPD
jgi:hypothetical protein